MRGASSCIRTHDCTRPTASGSASPTVPPTLAGKDDSLSLLFPFRPTVYEIARVLLAIPSARATGAGTKPAADLRRPDLARELIAGVRARAQAAEGRGAHCPYGH